MATTATATKTEKTTKKPISLVDRIKTQLNTAALKGKISVDELSELQQHITKVSGLIS